MLLSKPPDLVDPFIGFTAIILGTLAIVFGRLGLGRVRSGLATNNKMSISGVVLGVCTLALGVWGAVTVVQGVYDLSNSLQGDSVSSVEGRDRVDGHSALPQDPAHKVQVAAFGDTYTWESGVQVAVQPPQAYSPSSSAFGATGARAVSLEVNVTNGSDAPLELSTLFVQASFNGQMITPIYDSANNLNGTPKTSVLPGKAARFTTAFPVEEQAGELQVEMTPGFVGERVYFTGQA